MDVSAVFSIGAYHKKRLRTSELRHAALDRGAVHIFYVYLYAK
jgi:hypothetical protein